MVLGCVWVMGCIALILTLKMRLVLTDWLPIWILALDWVVFSVSALPPKQPSFSAATKTSQSIKCFCVMTWGVNTQLSCWEQGNRLLLTVFTPIQARLIDG